jgi:hypothetical protein
MHVFIATCLHTAYLIEQLLSLNLGVGGIDYSQPTEHYCHSDQCMPYAESPPRVVNSAQPFVQYFAFESAFHDASPVFIRTLGHLLEVHAQVDGRHGRPATVPLDAS